MTSYSLFATGATKIAILANTWTLRIAKIEVTNAGTAAVLGVTCNRYAGAALSGGTAITPVPMRDGAPPATATAKTGATLSGTASATINIINLPVGSASAGPSANTYQYPFDLLISPGNAFYLVPSTANGNVTVFFEEIRLAWSQ